MTKRSSLFGVGMLLGLGACMSGGDPLQGFALTIVGDGPRVAWDIDAKPLPEIPLPNDVATRPDPTSPTGRRINASLEAPTQFERTLRARLNRLDGFSTFGPVWIMLEPSDPDQPLAARLDLPRLAAAQQADDVFEDDPVLLINVTKGSKTYGEAQLINIGNGNYPVTVENPRDYFEHDPRDQASSLIFDTYDEDLDADGNFDVFEDKNQNGVLDPGEDLDGDGRLDIHEDTDSDGHFDSPNLWGTATGDPTRMHPYFDLIDFYELETETLIFRPLYPLEERTTYAVVLTTALTNENGDPVHSPFEYVHHLQQTEALRPLFEDGLLARYGRETADVAFAWTFTTQSATGEMVALREGVNGVGPFAHLADSYPPEIDRLVRMNEEPLPRGYRLSVESLLQALKTVFENVNIANINVDDVQPVLDTFGAVDYIIAGDYTSPNFIDPGGGVFDIDAGAGTGPHTPESIRFLLIVPKEQYGTRPFPVALYCHGHTSLKLEGLVFSGIYAKYGIATFVIDAMGHGLPLGPEFEVIFERILGQFEGEGLIPFYDAIKKDRARDLNGDTIVDPAGDFWTHDLFHSRDMVRQTLVDYFQASRIMRSFDGVKTWSLDLNGDGVQNDLAGDFDADGVVDVGGPDRPMYSLGLSMGGIHSTILGALEPPVVATAPVSPGGGLAEVASRTDLSTVVRSAILPLLGPMLVTEPHPATPELMQVMWLVNDVMTKVKIPVAYVGDIEGSQVVNELRPGDLFTVHTLTNGEHDEVVVNAQRQVRAHIPSDRGDDILIEIYRPDGTFIDVIDTFEVGIEAPFYGVEYPIKSPLKAIQGGLSHRRNTPRLRRLLALAQTIIDPADPINYVRYYADPLDIRPEGRRETNTLLILTMGDMTVPVSSGVALGRAAGVIGFRDPDPRYGMTHNELLIDRHVVEGVDELFYFRDDCCNSHCGQVNFDVDDLSRGLHSANLPRLGVVVEDLDCGAGDVPAVCTAPCETYDPLRAEVTSPSGGIRAVRFPALGAKGQHVIDVPDPTAAFDPSTFSVNQSGIFLRSGGTVLSDHPCLATNDCTACVGEDCPNIPPPTTVVVP